jgi:hypothetical protein
MHDIGFEDDGAEQHHDKESEDGSLIPWSTSVFSQAHACRFSIAFRLRSGSLM